MRAIAATFLAATAALATRASGATNDSSSAANFCVITDKVVLTTCGSLCGEDQACAQYPSKASATCSAAARNKCVQESSTCEYQCLQLYNTQYGKWTLFVKDPKASDTFSDGTDAFPAAPIDQINDYDVPSDAKAIQITGFDAVDVAKGSTKTLQLDAGIFQNAATVTSLAIANVDLSQLLTNFLPKSISTLVMENCQLSDVPSDVASMTNIRTLNVSKNTISELATSDSKLVKNLQALTTLNLRANELTDFNWVLPALTTLDLGDNKLTAVPSAIFNMTKITWLNLAGNQIENTTFTAAQFSFFKRLSSTSALGFTGTAGSCADGQREDTVLGATVCVIDSSLAAATTAPPKSSSSTSVVLIVCIVLAAIVVVGLGGFCWYRRRSKANSEFYASVMEHGNNSGGNIGGNTGGNGNTTGQSRSSIFGRGRASSAGPNSTAQGRPSRAASSSSRPSLAAGTRPSKQSVSTGGYAEISKYQEELQSSINSSSIQQSGGSRQRERAQINQNVVRISGRDINYTRTIAKGAFGEVWLAHLGRDLVAVKKLLTKDPSSVGDFVAELNLLASLSHPRILTLVGACWEDDFSDIQIVTEYMDSGDLLTVLRGSSPTELTWETGKATYCVQVCEAVFYLHSLQPALIHRDIKSRNILVDSRNGAKLSDFGESRERTIQNTMTAGVGTARWVAPEIILGDDYSELADIYSLGVLLTELDTHQIPFENLKLEEHMIVQRVATGKLRPQVSDTCPEVIRRLAHECLQFDPQLRPSAARVLQTLMASPLIRRLSTISDSE